MFDLDTHQYLVSHDVKFVVNNFPFARSSPVNDAPLVGVVEFFDDDIVPVEVYGEHDALRGVECVLVPTVGAAEAPDGLVKVGAMLGDTPSVWLRLLRLVWILGPLLSHLRMWQQVPLM